MCFVAAGLNTMSTALASLEPTLDVATKGQVFTPTDIVAEMLSLCQNYGSILEPSAGDGAFISRLEPEAVGIELDDKVITDPRVQPGDFFSYPTSHKFATIIGNPPYVRFQDIEESTKKLLNVDQYDLRTNLYIFFIDKCLSHLEPSGELIFITPRNFMKATSARNLNRRLYEEGSFTYFNELGDARPFASVSPNCVIWRWEKDCYKRSCPPLGKLRYNNGQIWFGDGSTGVINDFFEVKVGAVSGADYAFINE